jgi:hypothetical protein
VHAAKRKVKVDREGYWISCMEEDTPFGGNDLVMIVSLRSIEFSLCVTHKSSSNELMGTIKIRVDF